MKQTKWICAIALLLTAAVLTAKSWQAPDWDIVLMVNCKDDPTVKLAATELKNTMEKIYDQKFPIVSAPVKGNASLVLGIDKNLKEGEIHVYQDDWKLYLTGDTARSVLHAVYSFLQQEMGVRWLWPGVDGERIPRQAGTFSGIRNLDRRHIPQIKYRGFHTCGAWFRIHDFRLWMSRNFINIHRHGGWNVDVKKTPQPFINMLSDHNIRLPREMLKDHPAYFAEIDGRRRTSQVCLNNPDVDKLIYQRFVEQLKRRPALEILSVFPSDNQEYCQCVKCKAKGTSTSWFDFYNRLTDRLKADFPKLKFATIAYQGYIDVPANPVRNSEFVEYATYSRCNVHRFGDPRCKQNERVLNHMKQWSTTGVTMGNYGYEFDMFTGFDQPFTPFYSMIADAIKMTPKLKQTALITEVGLSPRQGPELMCSAFKNRLAEYIYAQMMWNTDADLYTMLADWCYAAYGKEAGKHMFEYYKLLDRQWDSMNAHHHILGRATGIAQVFLTPEVKEQAKALLDQAAAVLAKENGPDTQAHRDALQFDQKLFAQWLVFLTPAERISIPKLEKAEDFKDGRGAWTKDTLLIRNSPDEPFTIELSSGIGGETWFFQYEPDNKTKSWQISGVGIREDVVLDWQYKDGVAAIPFASLGMKPAANDKWQIRFATGKEKLTGEPAMLHFCGSSEVGKTILWWPGSLQREKGSHISIRKNYEDMGWEIRFAENAEEYAAAKPDVYYFRNPNHQNPIPVSAFETIRENVKNGALAVFVSYSQLPLEKYFNNPSFSVGVGGTGRILLSQRHTRTILPGDWSQKPHNVLHSLKHGYTPAYNLVPAQPGAWTTLATLPYTGEPNSPERPYILLRKYGKGMVMVIAADPWIPIHHLIVNVLKNPPPLKEAE